MILIFGGAYQGKLDYVKEVYGVKEDDIFDCSQNDNEVLPYIDFNKRVINNFNRFVRACTIEGIESLEYIKKNIKGFRDKIIISDDVTCGIVPLDKKERAYREEVGHCMVYLGKEADTVVRLFCGLPQVIK